MNPVTILRRISEGFFLESFLEKIDQCADEFVTPASHRFQGGSGSGETYINPVSKLAEIFISFPGK